MRSPNKINSHIIMQYIRKTLSLNRDGSILPAEEKETGTMNLNQLRVFLEAARAQNFSQAARNLHVTQPAVTGQIRALEESLDIKLFKKRGRKMMLTEAGAMVLKSAHEIFEIERRTEHMILEFKELKRGILKVGTTKTYARYLMPAFITSFHAVHPGIKIILDEGSSDDVTASLFKLQNELAIIAVNEADDALTLHPFREEEVLLFAAPSHPLASRKSIKFAELEGQPVIMKEEGSSTRRKVMAAFERRNVAPNILVETSNVGFIREMVEKGEGVAFLVRSAMEEEIARGRVKSVPITDEKLLLHVSIAHLADQDLSPAARAFMGILKG